MSTRVNRPTDVKVKEKDVNRKLQIYGIISAFQQGKVPSNEQIDVSLNSFLKTRAMTNPSKRLSPEGQALVQDFRSVVEQAKVLLLTKNEGNLLQDFIWTSQHIDGGNAAVPGAPVSADQARQHGQQAKDGFATLGKLLISNGQFRKLLDDAVVLFRDIAGDAAQNVANKVNPSEDELKRIDEPAPDNTWHDVPDMSAGNIKSQIKQTYNNKGPNIHRDDLKEAAGDASEAAHPSGSRDPAEAADLARRDQQHGTSSGVDAQAGAKNAAQNLKEKANNNIDEDTKQQVRDKREQTKNYMKEKMPEERREQVTLRMKKLLVECQGHSDYQQAITTLLDLAEEYAGHLNSMGQQSTGAVKGAHGDDSLKTAEQDLKTLIERFANSTSTDDLFEAVRQIYADADKDPELKSWFKKVDTYIRKCLKQQGYVMEDAATEEWNNIYDRGNFLLRDRYRNHTDRIADEVKFLADQFDQDPLNHQFANSMNKLFTDLGNDENGKPTFKPHLVKDLTEVILPAIFENIRYVPIPRIEYRDPMMDFCVENLVIESDNLTPNIFEVANDNYFRWGRKNVANKNAHSIMVSVSGIQMDLKDVSYYMKKKSGFPSITDTGVLDIFLGGSGLSFKMKMSTADAKDRANFFKVDSVVVDVKNLSVKIKKSNHKLLFSLAKSLALKTMRPAIQKAIEKVIKQKVEELDSMAYQVKLEADKAMQQAKNNPEEAQNIYQRYVTAAQNKLTQGKQKTQEVASKTTVNVAVTKEDSIFPDVHLPGGISSKATEYKQLAREGNSWQSPIFALGSASRTTTLPSPSKITRKAHNVTQGGVRGPQNIGNTGSMTNQLRDDGAQRSAGAGGSNQYANQSTGQYATGNANSYAAQNYSENYPVGAATTTGTPGTTGGFSKHMDQVFGNDGLNGGALGSNGHTNGSAHLNGANKDQWHTSLGSENPVLRGNV